MFCVLSRLVWCGGALGKMVLEVASLPKELGIVWLVFLKSVRTQVQRLSALP